LIPVWDKFNVLRFGANTAKSIKKLVFKMLVFPISKMVRFKLVVSETPVMTPEVKELQLEM